MRIWILVFAVAISASSALAQQPYRGAAVAQPNVPKGKPVVTVSVDGTEIKFDDVQPQPVAGRMMVPVRGVFEALGIYVEYDYTLRTITARKGNEDVELRIGEKVAHKNGAEIMLDVAPLLMKSHAMVPLRFIVETLGGRVDFDPAKNHVEITTKSRDADSPPQT